MAPGVMEKGARGTHFDAAHLRSPIVSKQKERRLQKICLTKMGSKDASLASRKKHLALNVVLQRAILLSQGPSWRQLFRLSFC